MLLCETHNLKGVGNDADSHELLSVVAAVHHERVGETLDDGALRLAEALDGVPASGVGDVYWLADLNVVAVMPYRQPYALISMRLCVPSPRHLHHFHLCISGYNGQTYVSEMSLISTSS